MYKRQSEVYSELIKPGISITHFPISVYTVLVETGLHQGTDRPASFPSQVILSHFSRLVLCFTFLSTDAGDLLSRSPRLEAAFQPRTNGCNRHLAHRHLDCRGGQHSARLASALWPPPISHTRTKSMPAFKCIYLVLTLRSIGQNSNV